MVFNQIIELVKYSCKEDPKDRNDLFLMCCDKLVELLHNEPRELFDILLKKGFWSSDDEYHFFTGVVDEVINQSPLMFEDGGRGVLCRYVMPIEFTAKKDGEFISNFIPFVLSSIFSSFIEGKINGLFREVHVSQQLVAHNTLYDTFKNYHLYSTDINLSTKKENQGEVSEFVFYGKKIIFLLQVNIILSDIRDAKKAKDRIRMEIGDDARVFIEKTLASFYFFNRCSLDFRSFGLIQVSEIKNLNKKNEIKNEDHKWNKNNYRLVR